MKNFILSGFMMMVLLFTTESCSRDCNCEQSPQNLRLVATESGAYTFAWDGSIDLQAVTIEVTDLQTNTSITRSYLPSEKGLQEARIVFASAPDFFVAGHKYKIQVRKECSKCSGDKTSLYSEPIFLRHNAATLAKGEDPNKEKEDSLETPNLGFTFIEDKNNNCFTGLKWEPYNSGKNADEYDYVIHRSMYFDKDEKGENEDPAKEETFVVDGNKTLFEVPQAPDNAYCNYRLSVVERKSGTILDSDYGRISTCCIIVLEDIILYDAWEALQKWVVENKRCVPSISNLTLAANERSITGHCNIAPLTGTCSNDTNTRFRAIFISNDGHHIIYGPVFNIPARGDVLVFTLPNGYPSIRNYHFIVLPNRGTSIAAYFN